MNEILSDLERNRKLKSVFLSMEIIKHACENKNIFPRKPLKQYLWEKKAELANFGIELTNGDSIQYICKGLYLCKQDLSNVDFSDVDLEGSYLENATMADITVNGNTNINNCWITDVKNLSATALIIAAWERLRVNNHLSNRYLIELILLIKEHKHVLKSNHAVYKPTI